MPLTEVFEGRDATQVVELAGGKRQQSYHNVRGGSGRVRALGVPRSWELAFASVLQSLAPLILQRFFGATEARRGRQAPNYSKRYRTNAVQVRDGPEFGAGVAWVVGAQCSGRSRRREKPRKPCSGSTQILR